MAILFDDSRKLTLTTDGSGSARGSIVIPAAVAGSHEIIARGGGRGAVRPFTIRPRLGLSTTSIVAGRSLTVTLSGFDAGRTVKIRLYEVGSTTRYVTIGELRTSSTGGATRSLTIPRTTKGGTHKVVAYQTSSRNDDANLRVTALTATPRPRPTKTATPRPSVCEGASRWLAETFTRNRYVIATGSNAIDLWNADRLSVSFGVTLSERIDTSYSQQRRSNPPSAAAAFNGHVVVAYAEYRNAVYWLAVNVQAQINGDVAAFYRTRALAAQDFADGDAAIDRSNRLLPAFRDRCNV